MEGSLCYWRNDWWKGTGDSSSLAHGECSMRPPELNLRSSLDARSDGLEGASCAGGARRFMHALRRCHGSKAHRGCAAYLAEKLEPSGRSGGRSPYSESYYAAYLAEKLEP